MKTRTPARSDRKRSTKARKVGDLKTRADRATAVKGGIVINWTAASGGNRPGEDKGVIAIIRPE